MASDVGGGAESSVALRKSPFAPGVAASPLP